MALGDAWIDVHANTDPFERDLKRNLDKDLKTAGEDANKIMDEIGKGWGEHVSKSTSEEVKRHGHEFARAFEDSTVGKKVKIRYTYDYDKEGVLKGFKKIVSEVESAVGSAFSKGAKAGVDEIASSGSGFFDKIKTGLSDAVGAAFNVSGQSPLIPLLAVVMGDVLALILAAVQAANALVAVLATIPALLTAVGLQLGITLLAFHGITKAAQEAFAAKNADELKKALEGLTPAAQSFVLQLLPVKKMFDDIKTVVQQSFFTSLGKAVLDLSDALGPLIKVLSGPLSAAMGNFLKIVLGFFSSPTFKTFLEHVVLATIRFLNKFGPDLVRFLDGFIKFADSSIGFLNFLGSSLSGALGRLGSFLGDLAKDPATKQWFEDMKQTLGSVGDLIKALGEFVAVFMDQLNKAGGDRIIKELVSGVKELAVVLATPQGKKAMQELVDISIAAIKGTVASIETIIIALALIKDIAHWIWVALKDLYTVAKDTVVGIGETFEGIWNLIKKGWNAVSGFFDDLSGKISGAVGGWFDNIKKKFNEFKKNASSALTDIVGMFYEKGANMMSSLVDGLRSRFDDLSKFLHRVAGAIGGVFGASPAKWGPLSGTGWMTYRGKNLMNALNEGMQQGAQSLNTTVSNAASTVALGNVNLNFYGQQPSERDARMAGAAASSEIATRLAVSQTLLAIRTA